MLVINQITDLPQEVQLAWNVIVKRVESFLGSKVKLLGIKQYDCNYKIYYKYSVNLCVYTYSKKENMKESFGFDCTMCTTDFENLQEFYKTGVRI